MIQLSALLFWRSFSPCWDRPHFFVEGGSCGRADGSSWCQKWRCRLTNCFQHSHFHGSCLLRPRPTSPIRRSMTRSTAFPSLCFFFFCFSSSTWTQRFLFPGVRAVCSATAPHEPGAPASPYRLSLARHPKRSRAWCCAPAGGHRRAGGRRRGSRRPLDAFSGHQTYSAEGFLHVGSLGNNLWFLQQLSYCSCV